MKLLINLLLIVLIVFLGYLVYSSIKQPIVFQAERKKRETAVSSKLKQIREAQKMHRDVKGYYAGSWEELKHTLMTDSFRYISVSGSSDDGYEFDTAYALVADTIKSKGWNLDSFKYVPYGEGAMFEIEADTIQYQSLKTPVVQVGVQRGKFMGPYADASFSKYDDRYDPTSMMKFGNLSKPSLSGNWE